MGYVGIRENERDGTESTRTNEADAIGRHKWQCTGEAPVWILADVSDHTMAKYPKMDSLRELGRTL
jgi:hypothetical protein